MCFNSDEEQRLKELVKASYAMVAAVEDELDGFEQQDIFKYFRFKDLAEKLRTAAENLDYYYDDETGE